MAGDWIKMRLDLQTHPKVVRILSATKSDKFRVIGGLHAVWSVFDTHSSDGRLNGYSAETLDHIIGWEGFSGAMIAVGWLATDGEESLLLPEFDEHNGKSGKRRAEDQKRKRDDRKSPQTVRKLSENDNDEKWTREEKRREENKEIPHTPQAGLVMKSSSAISLKSYLEQCKLAQAKPIPEDDSVFDYAVKVGVPTDFLRLQWLEFKDRYGMDGAKRYKSWPSVFGKSVRGNWFKLWYASNDGGYALTTVGQQAKRQHGEAS